MSWLAGVLHKYPELAIFLVVPTLVMVIGAFAGDGGVTMANVAALGDGYILAAFGRSILLSAITAVIGAVLGAP